MVRKLLLTLMLCAMVPPALVWTLYKPARVIKPSWAAEVECIDRVCLDNPSSLPLAQILYKDGLRLVKRELGDFQRNPRMVFCSSQRCFKAFGFDMQAAAAVGSFGIVIGPRGWLPHYINHELIHHRQAEELGDLAMLTTPEWLLEGMAYSLSQDPRGQLTSQWQVHRVSFEHWHQNHQQDMWHHAREVSQNREAPPTQMVISGSF